MEFHPVASIFPMLTGDDYRELRDDIARNGLLESIWTYQNQIIDGRNRYTACLDAGVQPHFREWDGNGSLVSFVVSLNLKRRHLSSSQRAMAALEVERQLSEEAKANQGRRTDLAPDTQNFLEIIPKSLPEPQPINAAKQAAEILGTNHHYVTDAKRIAAEAPDLAEKVRDGSLTIPKAKAEMNRRERDAVLENGIDITVPDCKYRTVVIDPPWPMEKIAREVAPNQVGFEYPTMTIDEIIRLNIPADEDCHLFVWTTQKFLPETFSIMSAWNFRYVFTMVWHKNGGFQPFNLPQYNCEFVVYGRRGTPDFIETKAFPTCFQAPRREHSRKPDEFYDLVRRVAPGPRIDFFSREQRPGFDQFGNETSKFA